MSERGQRRHERFPVHLAVRFRSAEEFVVEYAQNLSAGGLFVRGVHQLAPLTMVKVEIELPSLGRFEVEGRVAHVCDEAMAAQTGRRPGIGIEITDRPPAFDDALASYLHRLGRRRDHTVMVDEALARSLFADAGYVTLPAPAPGELVAAFARADPPVVGVIVHRARAEVTIAEARAAGVDDQVHAYANIDELDEILNRLDEEIV